MRSLETLIRPNIQALFRQQSGKTLAPATAPLRLDRAEVRYSADVASFPSEAVELKVREALAAEHGLTAEAVLLVAGGKSPLDVLLRTCCSAQTDNVVLHAPAPLHYAELAAVAGIETRVVGLAPDFTLKAEQLKAVANEHTKIAVVCNPNFPTARLVEKREIDAALASFSGLLVVDETFAGFSRTPSLAQGLWPQSAEEAEETANDIAPGLAVIGSFAHKYAAASLELGYILAHPALINYLRLAAAAARPSSTTLQTALQILTSRRFDVDKWAKWTLEERRKVAAALADLPYIEEVCPSDANFLLIRTKDAARLHTYLLENGIAVAECSCHPGLADYLCITVGLRTENNQLIGLLRRF